ncbi:MAG TPA: nucleotide sugar dehydrogenase [Nitrososphaeraceae archaeon]|nr:nucleotide sugar dehydrogenase [Nitrososphaeraceae archaeon]
MAAHRYIIGIIGAGVVGGATGKGLQKLGYEVTFYDIDKSKTFSLRQEGYQVASSISELMSNSNITFVCVNTPTIGSRSNLYNDNRIENGSYQDLSQILSVLPEISSSISTHTRRHQLLVFRSTLLPGTMRNIVVDYLERNCSKSIGKDFDVCYNPEFLRQKSALEDFFEPGRVVIGEGTKYSSVPLVEIFGSLTRNIIITGYEEAEMIKYASNGFLALKISYFNEIAMVCKMLGIDDKTVSRGVALDRRIGTYGVIGGMPFGGACLPKDTAALTSFLRKLGIRPDLIETAVQINNEIEEITSGKQIIHDIDR